MSIPPQVTPPATFLSPEEFPSIEHLVTEDDTPVDGIYSEKQFRLLTEPLYCSWKNNGKPFVALANVGMLYADDQPPVVPDVLLSLDVANRDLSQKRNRSYFFWVFGKAPDVVIEVVSNKEGDELGKKRDLYARLKISYYVVWDPFRYLSEDRLQCFSLTRRTYEKNGLILEGIGLGLTTWQGPYEDMVDTWMRWTDENGKLIPTGAELAEQEHDRAEFERKRADHATERAERLAALLRAQGIDTGNGG